MLPTNKYHNSVKPADSTGSARLTMMDKLELRKLNKLGEAYRADISKSSVKCFEHIGGGVWEEYPEFYNSANMDYIFWWNIPGLDYVELPKGQLRRIGDDWVWGDQKYSSVFAAVKSIMHEHLLSLNTGNTDVKYEPKAELIRIFKKHFR